MESRIRIMQNNLKESKEKLDCGFISQEEYNKLEKDVNLRIKELKNVK